MSDWKKHRKVIEVKCENCDIMFEKTKSEYSRSEKLNKKHFCSLKCSREYRKVLEVICENCKIIFTPIKTGNRFCSGSCRTTFTNKRRTIKERNFSEEGLNNMRIAIRKKHNIDEYDENPNHCIECDKKLKYSKRKNKFCDINCKKKYDRKNMSEYQKYYRECQFKFNLADYSSEFEFSLIEKHGWYSPTNKNNNIGGVSRDHSLSVREGFELDIDPKMIQHPANCKLMIHSKNISKNRKSDITVGELKIRILEWDEKYK